MLGNGASARLCACRCAVDDADVPLSTAEAMSCGIASCVYLPVDDDVCDRVVPRMVNRNVKNVALTLLELFRVALGDDKR